MAYQFPSVDLLMDRTINNEFMDPDYVQEMSNELAFTLKSFGVDVEITGVKMTPYAVMFDAVPAEGVSVKTIRRLHADLELHMASPVEITSQGDKQYTIGISVKKLQRPIIGLREILKTPDFEAVVKKPHSLPVAAGMDVLGKPFCFDLSETPNLLVAGTTGSGKSVFLNDIILSLLFTRTPEEVNLYMVDQKIVDLIFYNGVPHLKMPVVVEKKKSLELMRQVDAEMDRRFQLFAAKRVKNIDAYNEVVSVEERLPRQVIVIDEYMEMMFDAPKELEAIIAKIASRARATGTHLILATQRPSTDVITNAIKSRIPCRASFTVVDWRESKTILDRTGAERLLGSGDMLYSIGDSALPVHCQAAYVSDNEVDIIIEDILAKNPAERRR